jgi:hypothetical protein
VSFRSRPRLDSRARPSTISFRIRTYDLLQTKDFNPFGIRTYQASIRPLRTREFKYSRINTYANNVRKSCVFRFTKKGRGRGGSNEP